MYSKGICFIQQGFCFPRKDHKISSDDFMVIWCLKEVPFLLKWKLDYNVLGCMSLCTYICVHVYMCACMHAGVCEKVSHHLLFCVFKILITLYIWSVSFLHSWWWVVIRALVPVTQGREAPVKACQVVCCSLSYQRSFELKYAMHCPQPHEYFKSLTACVPFDPAVPNPKTGLEKSLGMCAKTG